MDYRKVTAVIRPDLLEKVEGRLKKMGVPGLTVTKVKGYGEYANFYTSDWMLTHARIEIFIEVARADEIAIEIMDSAHTGLEGDGIVAILPVESVYHIRMRKKCTGSVC